MPHVFAALSLVSLVLFACGSDLEGGEGGTATGATCPSGSSVTYRDDVRPFMEAYCVRCHGSDVAASQRHGAPLDHNFDAEEGVLDAAEHVALTAAGGPDAINRAMPPDGPLPTDDERKKLGEWLACHAEAGTHHHDDDGESE